MFGHDSPSDLQQRILDTARRNPDAGPEEIASMCDCSASYVRETLKQYGSGLGGSWDFDLGLDDGLL